jgi:twitching motility protein PilU
VIPGLDELKVPPILGQLVLEKRGLILMVGATGTGKSTTLASMLDLRNRTTTGHILTIEDPIEYLFTSQKSVVNQREVGRDTTSMQVALKNALRQAPDCIMIGEIRDRETMTAALSYALSGHLVLATLHANNSYHALGRILSFYTPESRPVLLGDLAAGLRAIVSQRLLRATNGGRIPAVEVLLNTKLVGEAIANGDFAAVKEAMEKSLAEGSMTFEQDLARLIEDSTITRDEGLAFADSPTNLMWRLQNDMTTASRIGPKKEESDQAHFTEYSVDIHPDGAPPPKTSIFARPS